MRRILWLTICDVLGLESFTEAQCLQLYACIQGRQSQLKYRYMYMFPGMVGRCYHCWLHFICWILIVPDQARATYFTTFCVSWPQNFCGHRPLNSCRGLRTGYGEQFALNNVAAI